MKLWQRYLFRQLLASFIFLLCSIFAIYAVVDLSVNGVSFFSRGSFHLGEIALYYLRHFAMHLELFLPLAFLLSSLKVLFHLNQHRELAALQIAGLSKKRLLLPFFILAAALSTLCYLNNEYFAPQAQEAIATFRMAHSKPKKQERERLFVVSLRDGTELIYQKADPATNTLFDVFWVLSPNRIWHMKTLQIDPPKGQFVEYLTRNRANQFEKSESLVERDFPEIEWDKETVLQKFIPLERRPLSLLLEQVSKNSIERKGALAHLYYKLALPLLPFLILIGIAPFAMSYSRNKPLLLLVACSLFAFIALRTLLDALLILAENQALPAHLAIWGPLLALFVITIRPFART